jgi:hypothetical protein
MRGTGWGGVMFSLDLADRIANRDRTDIRRANAVRDKCAFATAR